MVLNDVFVHCCLWHFNLNRIKERTNEEWEFFFGSPHVSINLICKSKLHGRQVFRWSFMHTISIEGHWEICQGVFRKCTNLAHTLVIEYPFIIHDLTFASQVTMFPDAKQRCLGLWMLHWPCDLYCATGILLCYVSSKFIPINIFSFCSDWVGKLFHASCSFWPGIKKHTWDCCNIGHSLVVYLKFHL